jgi:glutaminyl-peptide cyclotransferase
MLSSIKLLSIAMVLVCFTVWPCEAQNTAFTPTAPVHSYRVVQAFPHDPQAFTQGLVFHNDELFESTGIRSRSSVRRVDLHTGQVLQIKSLPNRYFGEGLVVLDQKIIQLTWRSRKGFVYDRDTLDQIGTFSYPTEGWGLTHDGRHLILSDGTETLFFLDPDNFQIQRSIEVYDGMRPIRNLNELEYIDGWVYANVWRTHRIAIIDPKSGQVSNWLDLKGILAANSSNPWPGVLNGIAHDPRQDRLFITGKLWPTLFEIKPLPEINPNASHDE